MKFSVNFTHNADDTITVTKMSGSVKSFVTGDCESESTTTDRGIAELIAIDWIAQCTDEKIANLIVRRAMNESRKIANGEDLDTGETITMDRLESILGLNALWILGAMKFYGFVVNEHTDRIAKSRVLQWVEFDYARSVNLPIIVEEVTGA